MLSGMVLPDVFQEEEKEQRRKAKKDPIVIGSVGCTEA